jgi:hypothetical protein
MQRFSYWLNVVLAIGLFCVVFRYGCKPEYIDKPLVIEIVDSNAMYDQLESQYSNQMLKLYDSIEYLNKRLKSSKAKFKENYGAIIVKVGKNLENNEPIGIDSNCLITLEYANITIIQQDSIIDIQSCGLDAAQSQVTNLRKQVDYNIELKNEYKALYNQTETTNNKLEKKILRLKKSRILLFGLGLISGLSLVLVK